VIVGATGMVGGLRPSLCAWTTPAWTCDAIGRRKLSLSHPKLTQVQHPDFADCSALAGDAFGPGRRDLLPRYLYGAVSDAELRKTTVDYTVEFARVLHGSSPGAAFSFLSGVARTPTGRSRIAFARYKGQAENALRAMAFSTVYIFRPAYIYPVEPRRAPISATGCLRAIYPVFRLLFPNQVIPPTTWPAPL